MKIYHLDIRSESDSRFDMHFFYTHDNDAKSYQDLQVDYCNAYDSVIEKNDDFQIFISRVHEDLDPNKIKIYWHQDLPWDPAATHLKETWQQFDHIVYNSNWQADMFNKYLGVPYHRSSVLENAIEPIEYKVKPSRTDGIIRIIYHTTPHRGLELLVPVFEKLCEKHDNIQLDVYSSFKIYGWGERDAQYEALFERCKNHPKINYWTTTMCSIVKHSMLSGF